MKKLTKVIVALAGAIVISACVEESYYSDNAGSTHRHQSVRQARQSGEAPPYSSVPESHFYMGSPNTPPGANPAPPPSTTASVPPSTPAAAPVSAPAAGAVSGEAPPSSAN